MASKLNYRRTQSAIRECSGNITRASKLLGVSRQTLYTYMQKHPKLKTTRFESIERLLDVAELKLAEAVELGKPWAIRLVLTRQGKSRGWGLSVDLQTQLQTTGVVHVLELPDNGRSDTQPETNQLLEKERR